MSVDMSHVTDIQIPTYYTCDGTETGMCEVTIDGETYFFQLYNIVVGARIRFLNGVFSTDTPSMLINTQTTAEEEDVPEAPSTSQETVIETETSEVTVYYTLPTVAQGEHIETLATADSLGNVQMHYRLYGAEEWVVIPLLTDEEVNKISVRGYELGEVNFAQTGENVHIS